MRSMLFFCFFFLVFSVNSQESSQCNENIGECTFHPWVDIFKSQEGNGITITLDENGEGEGNDSFELLYNPDEQQFFPLSVVFYVKSTKEPQEKINYQLTQGMFQHACKKDSEENLQLIEGVTAHIDDKKFPGGSEDHKVTNVTTQKHRLTITFPEMKQLADENQSCYGRIGIIASLVDSL